MAGKEKERTVKRAMEARWAGIELAREKGEEAKHESWSMRLQADLVAQI